MAYGYGGYKRYLGNLDDMSWQDGQGLDTGFNLTGQAQRPPLLAPEFAPSAGAPMPLGGSRLGRFKPQFNTPQIGSVAAKAGGSFLAGGPLAAGISLAGDAINYLSSGDQRRFQKEQRNNARWAWGKAKGAYGKDVINPNDTAWAVRAASLPRMNQLGQNLDRRYGFDSGRAGGALAEAQLSTEAQAWLDAYLQNAGLKTSRDSNILGMLGG